MSGYQRFLPRDRTRPTAHAVAEAAEAAEVEAIHGPQAAEAVLKPAEVRLGDLQLQQASAEVQRRQSSGIPELQQLQQLQQASGRRIAETRDRDAGSRTQTANAGPDGGAARPGTPTEWREGVLRVRTMPYPPTYPDHAWEQLIEDAELFLVSWAETASALGWEDWELFGVHRQAPWHRLDGRGLVPALQGRELVALTDSAAVIRTARGACLTYHRKQRDPLHPAERCLVWGLE